MLKLVHEFLENPEASTRIRIFESAPDKLKNLEFMRETASSESSRK